MRPPAPLTNSVINRAERPHLTRIDQVLDSSRAVYAPRALRDRLGGAIVGSADPGRHGGAASRRRRSR